MYRNTNLKTTDRLTGVEQYFRDSKGFTKGPQCVRNGSDSRC